MQDHIKNHDLQNQKTTAKIAESLIPEENIMDWYLGVLKKYAEFSGRSQRKEYWMFVLFNFVISIVLGIIEGVIGTNGILSMLYILAIFIPGLAVTIRRLHDTDHSGWWVLIAFIPVLGFIALLVFMVLDSTPGENKYGPNPKGIAA